MLNKQRHLLEMTTATSTCVTFGDWPTQVTMDRDDWEDMGSPLEITTTIRPGDRLNGGNA